MNRRSFFQRLGAMFGVAAAAEVLPAPKPTTGGLFNPHANVYEQYFGKGGIRDKMRATAWRENGHTFYSLEYDKDFEFLSGAQWTEEPPARRRERLINLLDQYGTKREIAINEGL